MPSFTPENAQIILQPYTEAAPYTFTFTICSSATANDGAIPYGDSVSACTVKAYDADNEDVTSEIIDSSSVANNVVSVALNYPATSGAGSYKLTFQVATTNGAHLEFDFGGTYAPDRLRALDL